MKDEFVKSIGIWGQRHYNYLKRKSPTVINTMRMKGTLEQYLQDVDRDAEEMFSQLVKQLAEQDGISEVLKVKNQMLWVQRMNNIRNRATEIVNTEIIFM
ncbi:MAG: TnpV protein [Clostridia bacterium]|nr:TnpV protein [Clostridia bacterium]